MRLPDALETTREVNVTSDEDLFVGVDWGQEYHQCWVTAGDGSKLDESQVEHSRDGLERFCERLDELCCGDRSRVHVAIEVSHGAVVEALLERGFQVYSINPKQLDRFRDRFSPSGAKDDRRDAQVLASSLRTDPDAFRRLCLPDRLILQLRECSRMHDELQQDRQRTANRLREQLYRYYPQFLKLTGDVRLGWALELWQLAPSPDSVESLSEDRIRQLLSRYRVRRSDVSGVISTLSLRGPSRAPGAADAAQFHAGMLVERLTVLNAQLKRCRHELQRLLERLAVPTEGSEHRTVRTGDVEVARSMPGIGTVVVATLFAEASDALAERDYERLRILAGVAPVTRQSGKRRPSVVQRYACNRRLREAVYHLARTLIQKDPRAKARYADLRGKGHSHGRALRTVGDRQLRALCAMLRDGTDYAMGVA